MMTDSPSLRLAAMIRFSVPVWLGTSQYMSAPRRPSARTT